MKVVCKSNIYRLGGYTRELPLTIGRMYDVIETMRIPFSPARIDDPCGPFHLVVCDTGEQKHFEADMFRDLNIAEKRQLKLEELIK